MRCVDFGKTYKISKELCGNIKRRHFWMWDISKQERNSWDIQTFLFVSHLSLCHKSILTLMVTQNWRKRYAIINSINCEFIKYNYTLIDLTKYKYKLLCKIIIIKRICIIYYIFFFLNYFIIIIYIWNKY